LISNAEHCCREAVPSQSPELLQLWLSKCRSFSTRNGLCQPVDATALRLNRPFLFVTQPLCGKAVHIRRLPSPAELIIANVFGGFSFCGRDAPLVYQVSESLKQHGAIGHRHFRFYHFFQSAQDSRRSG
jgi:hypothetical protein